MSTSQHSILFLSGAGLPAWIWDDVRRRLEEPDGEPRAASRAAALSTTVAPRPAGAGSATLRDYAEAALASVHSERVTIVAHSAGGVVGAEVARLAPQRVGGFLAVSAIIPRPGGSFVTAMPIPNRWILSAAMRLAGTRPPDAVIRKSLAHGLEERTTDRLIANFTPESPRFYRDRTGAWPWGGARGYAVTTRDRELSPGLQRRFAAELDRPGRLGRPGQQGPGAPWRRELATGHLPMLEDPVALAETIASFLAPSEAPG